MKLSKEYLNDIIRLIEYKYPERYDVIEQLRNKSGSWVDESFFVFDIRLESNDLKFSDNLDLFTKDLDNLSISSDIIIRILDDGLVYSVEFLAFLPSRFSKSERKKQRDLLNKKKD